MKSFLLFKNFIDCIDEEEDEEFLVELCRGLPTLLDNIGGPSQVGKLLRLFEHVVTQDEQNVRREAAKTLKAIIPKINISDILNDLMDLVNRLSHHDFVSQKLSAMAIISCMMSYVGSNQKATLCTLLKKFSNDPYPLVKKELAYYLKDFCTFLEEDFFVEIVSNILKEKSEFAKIPIFDCIVAMGGHKNISKIQDFVEKVLNILSNDECWRVRYTIAEKMHEVLINEK